MGNMISLASLLYEKALAGERVMLTGDSFFIGAIEKQLINKLADAETVDVSLAMYRPALNAHFISGGQIIIIDFFTSQRGLSQYQHVDNLDKIYVLESSKDSMKQLLDSHIAPIATTFEKVEFIMMEG